MKVFSEPSEFVILALLNSIFPLHAQLECFKERCAFCQRVCSSSFIVEGSLSVKTGLNQMHVWLLIFTIVYRLFLMNWAKTCFTWAGELNHSTLKTHHFLLNGYSFLVVKLWATTSLPRHAALAPLVNKWTREIHRVSS